MLFCHPLSISSARVQSAGALIPELLVAKLAHSHSASQFRWHLPSHWNSIILPPHCGQTRLMIEEMMLAFDSPGSVSMSFMNRLLNKRSKLPGALTLQDCLLAN